MNKPESPIREPDTDGDTLNTARISQAEPRPPGRADTGNDGLTDLVETNDGSFNGPADTGTNPSSPTRTTMVFRWRGSGC
jgi:hypothetical protein